MAGEKVNHRNGGYNAIMHWLSKNYGKADRCENPHCEHKSEIFHWRRVGDKPIEHNRASFQMLCNYCYKHDDGKRKLVNCPACRRIRDIREFQDGKYKTCEKCRQSGLQRYRDNREEMLAKQHTYYHSDLEKTHDRINKNNRKFRSKTKIGLLIKAEALNEPTRRQKNLWNGRGYWSKEYFRCIECSTTIYKHVGNGLCAKCYRRLSYENSMLETNIKAVENRRKHSDRFNEHMRKRTELANKFIDKARNDELKRTPVIDNLLNHLESKNSVRD